MELTETIESINRQLIDLYGIDTITGDAIWRVVWSEDQFEHRLGTYDDFVPGTNVYLRTVTEVRHVKKYPWIKEKYTLEKLVVIPAVNTPELPATKISYEPMFPFQDDYGRCMPPTILACKFIIDTVNSKLGKKVVYKDPLAGLDTQQLREAKAEELNQIQKELFGNETDTGDALAHGEAVVVPRNYDS